MNEARLTLFANHLSNLRELPGAASFRLRHGHDTPHSDPLSELPICFPNEWIEASYSPAAARWVALREDLRIGASGVSPYHQAAHYFGLSLEATYHLFAPSGEYGVSQRPDQFGGRVIGFIAAGPVYADQIMALMGVLSTTESA